MVGILRDLNRVFALTKSVVLFLRARNGFTCFPFPALKNRAWSTSRIHFLLPKFRSRLGSATEASSERVLLMLFFRTTLVIPFLFDTAQRFLRSKEGLLFIQSFNQFQKLSRFFSLFRLSLKLNKAARHTHVHTQHTCSNTRTFVRLIDQMSVKYMD